MNSNSTENKVRVNSEHNLIIQNFNSNDTGLYYCKRLEGETDEDEKYNYLVDLIFQENVTSVETGNFTDWRKYYEEYFVPINALFSESQGAEFSYMRNSLNIEMEIVTQWQPWGICEVCGRPKNEGIRKKTGFCRIRLTRKQMTNSSASLNPDEKFLTNAKAISCRSQILGRLVPGISNLTRIIPNFVQVQPCEGTCNPGKYNSLKLLCSIIRKLDAEGLGKGWKAGKTSAFKYRKTVVLAENSHLTVICPESTLENVVIWKRNGKVLKSGESVPPPNPEEEPRIIVDTFNTLYLVDVKESEEGNYTCQVDDVRMQQIVVFVISKAKILTQGLLKRCFVCRSRGELGSCKDPFTVNATQVELEKGVETVPCASGWCGKILETENALKEEYGVATQRMCLQRGPSDSEDRCAYTKWNYRRVLMCFCKGDLCNSGNKFKVSLPLLIVSFVITASRLTVRL
ncbi:uncharacterized protein BDFB_006913, partial [Asbolus verrucosus]